MRYWLKQCPRCQKGDLREERDTFGTYVACVQCGYALRAEEEAVVYAVPRQQPAREREKIAA
jgi:Zn ribbon nucleic-acid-binding protein